MVIFSFIIYFLFVPSSSLYFSVFFSKTLSFSSPIHTVLSIPDHIPLSFISLLLTTTFMAHCSCGNEGVAIFEGGTWSVRLCTLQSLCLSYLLSHMTYQVIFIVHILVRRLDYKHTLPSCSFSLHCPSARSAQDSAILTLAHSTVDRGFTLITQQ